MSESIERGLQRLENNLRRLASLPEIAGGAPTSTESSLERINEIVSNWTPGGSVPLPDLTSLTLWTPNDVPATLDSGDGSANELGVLFRSDFDGFIKGVRFYKGAAG